LRSGRRGSGKLAGSGHFANDGLQRKLSSSSGQRASLACEVGCAAALAPNCTPSWAKAIADINIVEMSTARKVMLVMVWLLSDVLAAVSRLRL